MSSKTNNPKFSFQVNEFNSQVRIESANKILSKLNSQLHPKSDLITNFEDQSLKSESTYERRDNTLDLLRELQEIISGDNNLSKDEKAEFCKSQRHFMKLYLKKLNGIG